MSLNEMEVLTIEEAIKYLESKGVPEDCRANKYSYYYKGYHVGLWQAHEICSKFNCLYTHIGRRLLTKKNIDLTLELIDHITEIDFDKECE